jgi:hypothetical protein
MEGNVYSTKLSTQTLRVPSSTVSLPLVLLISLLGYAAAKKVTFVRAHQSETHGFVLTVFCVLAAIPFIGVRYIDFVAAARGRARDRHRRSRAGAVRRVRANPAGAQRDFSARPMRTRCSSAGRR